MNRSKPTRSLAALLLVACVVLTAGCGSGAAEDPILRMSAAEALERGKELMEREKYSRARELLSHAFEVEPNSRAGREGLLLLADSYYLAGNQANWIQAEAKYRDFLNRFPTSEQAAYAQYQIANSLAKRVEKPNRDQSATFKAVQAYQELVRLYPTSEYAAEAQAKIQEVQDQLAAHEFVIGDFYLRYRYPAAAAGRFEDLLERYPEYSERDKVLYHLGLAYMRSRVPDMQAKAAPTFEQLAAEHPESPWLDQVPSDLPAVQVPEAEADGQAAKDAGSEDGTASTATAADGATEEAADGSEDGAADAADDEAADGASAEGAAS